MMSKLLEFIYWFWDWFLPKRANKFLSKYGWWIIGIVTIFIAVMAFATG